MIWRLHLPKEFDTPVGRHDASQFLLSLALEKEAGIDLARETVAFEKDGKPYLADHPEWGINMSHCEGCAAAAVFFDKRVGVDVEKIRAFPEKVLPRVLAPSEREILDQAVDRQRMFFRFWTLKESYAKADGRGLSIGLSDVVFSLDEAGNILSAPKGASFSLFEDEQGFLTALCLIDNPIGQG